MVVGVGGGGGGGGVGHTKNLIEYVGRYAFYSYAISVSHSIQTL